MFGKDKHARRAPAGAIEDLGRCCVCGKRISRKSNVCGARCSRRAAELL